MLHVPLPAGSSGLPELVQADPASVSFPPRKQLIQIIDRAEMFPILSVDNRAKCKVACLVFGNSTSEAGRNS
jgi:hypothetical protein